ncbi:hypothetical protein, partial [Methylobacterium sp. J-092]|uniref:hypothetical protein n=1 Tax=Methylobacterium sp. J-092 TaxID=2836667 RepID=UPI001FBB6311
GGVPHHCDAPLAGSVRVHFVSGDCDSLDFAVGILGQRIPAVRAGVPFLLDADTVTQRIYSSNSNTLRS